MALNGLKGCLLLFIVQNHSCRKISPMPKFPTKDPVCTFAVPCFQTSFSYFHTTYEQQQQLLYYSIRIKICRKQMLHFCSRGFDCILWMDNGARIPNHFALKNFTNYRYQQPLDTPYGIMQTKFEPREKKEFETINPNYIVL